MANIKFSVRGKSKQSKIYVRFIINRQIDYKVSTPLTINPEYFNNDTGKVRKVSIYKEREKMELQLRQLSAYIDECFNVDSKAGKVSGSSWLKGCVNAFFNISKESDLIFISNYAEHYYKNLEYKRNDKTGVLGVSKATQSKYKTIALKIISFQKYKRKKYKLIEINTNFRNEFLTYLLEVEKLGRNTAGRYIKFLKTICLDAQKNGLDVSKELGQIKGFTVKIDKIYLSNEDLEKIENANITDEQLVFARDWLIIGCGIGQRVSDLLSLKKENLTQHGNLDLIELVQQKTQKKVMILISNKVSEILLKYGGNFPPQYKMNLESAKTVFNREIKKIGKMAGLTKKIQGAKINPNTNRKESGIFEKWELITSHICRRSFATNNYGEMPTPLIMAVTGHSTEKEFINYIGKTNIDYAEQMAKYWNIESQRKNIKNGTQSPLKIAK